MDLIYNLSCKSNVCRSMKPKYDLNFESTGCPKEKSTLGHPVQFEKPIITSTLWQGVLLSVLRHLVYVC